MFIQHNCIAVRDIEKSVAFYRDIMGFIPLTPPEHVKLNPAKRAANAPDNDFTLYQEDCGDQCFKIPNCESYMAVMLVDPNAPAGGGCIEIQCYKSPATTYVEPTYLSTGIKEICFHVDTKEEVEAWEAKLKAAGVDMRTEIWAIGDGANTHYTLLFHDPDGIILQIAC